MSYADHHTSEPTSTPKRLTRWQTLQRAGGNVTSWTRRWLAGETLEVPAQCEAGCYVEADGKCPHGPPSIIRASGMI